MSKIKKTGKKLENLIKIIQESLIDSHHTVIHQNYKIPNQDNRKREFDILIESKINDFTIKVAIECKEYSMPVSVDKIEAFKGKCDRHIDINKKIFVAQNGYQADAINAARDFGIELYKIEDVNHNTIKEWFPSVRQLSLRFSLYPLTIYNGDAEDDTELPAIKNDLIYFYQDRSPEHIHPFICELLLKKSKEIYPIALKEFMDRGCKEPGKKINMPFKMGLYDVYMIDETDTQIPIVGVSSSIDIWLEEKTIDIIEANSLMDLNGKVKTNNISIPIGEKEKAHFIISKDKYSIFHTDENGTSQELKVLGTYKPNQKNINE